LRNHLGASDVSFPNEGIAQTEISGKLRRRANEDNVKNKGEAGTLLQRIRRSKTVLV